MVFFRKKEKDTEPPSYPVRQCIDLVGRADSESLRETLIKLYQARRTVLTECGQAPNAEFAEFKKHLRPDQASQVADKTRVIGRAIGKDKERTLDEMVFMLIAASLHARAGAKWISSQHAAFIDSLIARSEEIAHR